MRVILREGVLLAITIAVLAGSQNSVPKAPAIPPKTLPGPDQPPTPIPNFPSSRERPLAIAADKRTVNGKTIQYQGHVRMTTDSVIVTADELSFDSATQSAKATGNVAIQMRPLGSLIVPVSQ
jgi:lipopolysaccharide assembly outer membrane protein LptD (OstA)